MNLQFDGKKVLVLGSGVTGSAVVKVLDNFGAKVRVADEHSSKSMKDHGIALEEALSSQWDFAVVSPGWKTNHPAVESLRAKSIPLMSEVDLAWQNS